MLRRKIERRFEEWSRDPDKRALLVWGARQVGKTTSVRTFASQAYDCFIEINFEEKPSLKAVFSGDLDADTLYEKLSAAGLGELRPHHTLLFLDEIQSCPEARTALKFLVEDGRLDVIASGSLLGLNYRDVSSYPAGYEQKVEMHSLDFEEFLWANDIPVETITALYGHFQAGTAVDPFIHERMMELFKRYMIVGGMPAVVVEYLKMKDIQRVIEVQQMILSSYRDDISKYAGRDKNRAKAVFDSIPMQLMEKNKKFKLAAVQHGAKNRTYEDAVLWLSDAGIAAFCFNVSELRLPFELSEKRNAYKFFLCDTGLLSAMSLGNVQAAILAGELSINEGAVTENAVADLLRKRGRSLHYYDRKGRLEIDFLIAAKDGPVPVEVKSGKDSRRHASLTNILKDSDHVISRAVVLCTGNMESVGKVTYMPLYMVMFL